MMAWLLLFTSQLKLDHLSLSRSYLLVSTRPEVRGLYTIDRKSKAWYYVTMINITNIIKSKYYTYQPGEFLPVYSGGQLLNKREFHLYKLKWIAKHHRAFTYQLTHQRG